MLRVLGRRKDGYHSLQTVFQFLNYADQLAFRPLDSPRIQLETPLPGVPPAQDLVVRAASLLQQHSGLIRGVSIRVEKRLPLGGGLGGGSSDAATTLVALNQLWGAGFTTSELAALGLRLGADVPVFVQGLAAWGEGVGATLTPIDLPQPWYLVLIPPCQVSTAAVFSAPELTRNSPRITIADFLAGREDNDCLPVVRKLFAPVADALDWLSDFAPARLTGTGACVFASFADEASARGALAQRPAQIDGFVAQGLNRSPLLGRLVR